jgi:hypothetical protein
MTPPEGAAAAADEPARFSRPWFGHQFFGAWGLLALVNLATQIFGWERRGLLFSLVFWPLLAAWIATGVPWIVLLSGELIRAPKAVRTELRFWILVLIAVVAVGFAIGLAVDGW